MASNPTTTRRKRTIVEEFPEEDVQSGMNEEPGDDPESDASLKNFIDGLGPGTITFKVFRATTKGQEFAFSGEDEFDEEVLQEMYPQGGKFVIRVYKNQKYQAPSYSIRIAPRPYQSHRNDSQNGNGSGNDFQITMLRDQLQRQHEMLMSMIQNATGSANQNPPMSPKDMVEMLVMMKQLQPDTNLDVLMKGIELARDVEGSGDIKMELLRAVKDVAPVLPSLFGQQRQSAPSPTVPATPIQTTAHPNPPVLPAQTSTAQPSSTSSPSSPDMQLQIRMGIALLKRKCDQGVPPEFFVDQAMFFADQEMYQRLISEIVNNDFETFARKLDESILEPAYRDWFEKIYTGIRAEFDTDSDDDTNANGEDDSHAESNRVDGNTGGNGRDAIDAEADGGARADRRNAS